MRQENSSITPEQLQALKKLIYQSSKILDLSSELNTNLEYKVMANHLKQAIEQTLTAFELVYTRGLYENK